MGNNITGATVKTIKLFILLIALILSPRTYAQQISVSEQELDTFTKEFETVRSWHVQQDRTKEVFIVSGLWVLGAGAGISLFSSIPELEAALVLIKANIAYYKFHQAHYPYGAVGSYCKIRDNVVKSILDKGGKTRKCFQKFGGIVSIVGGTIILASVIYDDFDNEDEEILNKKIEEKAYLNRLLKSQGEVSAKDLMKVYLNLNKEDRSLIEQFYQLILEYNEKKQ